MPSARRTPDRRALTVAATGLALAVAGLFTAPGAHAEPTETVTYSAAQLDAIVTDLNEAVDTAGVAWGVEDAAGQVFIEADATVDDTEFAALAEAAAPYGDAVELRRTVSELTPYIQGGRFITENPGSTIGSCSVGFNVRKKSDPNSLYMLTAGHCTATNDGVVDWYDGSTPPQYVGYDAGGWFPGNDFGLIKHNNAGLSKPGNVWLHSGTAVQDITHSRDPGLNERVCKSGWRTGYGCGYVGARNVTVVYADVNGDGRGEQVSGLFMTDVCADRGDSGGAVFHNDAALGLVSGGYYGSEGCVMYAQPVNEALSWYEVEVY